MAGDRLCRKKWLGPPVIGIRRSVEFVGMDSVQPLAGTGPPGLDRKISSDGTFFASGLAMDFADNDGNHRCRVGLDYKGALRRCSSVRGVSAFTVRHNRKQGYPHYFRASFSGWVWHSFSEAWAFEEQHSPRSGYVICASGMALSLARLGSDLDRSQTFAIWIFPRGMRG